MQAHQIKFKTTPVKGAQYFAQNEFKIEGTGLWGLELIGQLLQTLPSLGTQSISMQYKSGTFTWTLEGKIYG
jgi:hypothetical protein